MDQHYVALLRGINVGGRHLIAMPALTRLFAELGCTGVSSYIPGGNVLFTPPAGGPRGQERVASDRKAIWLCGAGCAAQPRGASAGDRCDPLATPLVAPKLLHVVLLAEPLDAELQKQGAGEEQLAARGSELLPVTAAWRGKVKAGAGCVAARRPATNTMRTWQTLLKLGELLDSEAEAGRGCAAVCAAILPGQVLQTQAHRCSAVSSSALFEYVTRAVAYRRQVSAHRPSGR